MGVVVEIIFPRSSVLLINHQCNHHLVPFSLWSDPFHPLFAWSEFILSLDLWKKELEVETIFAIKQSHLDILTNMLAALNEEDKEGGNLMQLNWMDFLFFFVADFQSFEEGWYKKKRKKEGCNNYCNSRIDKQWLGKTRINL